MNLLLFMLGKNKERKSKEERDDVQRVTNTDTMRT